MCNMDDRPEQRPEGKLIGEAQRRSPLSQRQAATRAGISENHWRNIVKGYSTISAGVRAPIRGAADTVARMAQAVEVTPEQLAEADREDAAEELRALPPAEPPEEDRDAVVERLTAQYAAQQAQIDELQRQVKEMLDGAEDRKSG